MVASVLSDQKLLDGARRIARHLAGIIDWPVSLRLWDGSIVPLGGNADDKKCLVIANAGVVGAILRRPTLETVFRHYADGRLDVQGTDFLTFLEIVRQKRRQSRLRLSDLRKGFPWTAALPFLLVRGGDSEIENVYRGDESGHRQSRRDNRKFIQFHYDASNEFYALFLDREMVYSCGYFTDWSNSIDQAQQDKLDLICRKLRLEPDEAFLDIGCGWGALICHAAQNFGVRATGVTLSQEQHDYAIAKIDRLGLGDRVTVSLCDYRSLAGSYDKISSIGMYEHVGIANYPTYFRKIMGLLKDDGIFLNHGITRRARSGGKSAGRISANRRVLLKYIFPGSELDDIGHSLQVMEACGFEIHDVEGLRAHYGRTCRLWYERLLANREAAIAHVGPERYRMWLAYLAGVTGTFEHGAMRIYQTIATKRTAKGGPVMPSTRADIYRP